MAAVMESVAMRQSGAYDFETHYESLCALQSTCPIPAVKANLNEGVLDLNGDRIRSNDWVPVLDSLRINKTLEFIAIRSYYQAALEEENEKKDYLGKRKPPAVRSKEITNKLCKSLRECLNITPALNCIELQGLPLKERDLHLLARGVAKNATLQHLSLEFSRIGDEGLEQLLKGVKNSPTVTSLNFTGCSLSPKGAEFIAKIIRHQAMRRHNEAWQDSLRYRRPDLDRMAGIRRITLNYNPMLGDQAAMVLAEVLKDDLWLKALDLQHSGVSNQGAQSLLDVLKYNTTIVVLDVRNNPMIDRQIQQNIMEQVMINCNGADTDYRWLKAEPLKDPAKDRARVKRRVKTLQNQYGRRGGRGGTLERRRSKSAGSLQLRAQENASHYPWRTAERAGRYRGFPPERPSSHTRSFEDVSLSASSQEASEKEDAMPDEPHSLKELQIDLEQAKRTLAEERNARRKADERVLELVMENQRLRYDNEDLRNRTSALLDDDSVLESIETTFKQFHAFLDLLRDAGLGQLVHLAGFDESSFALPSSMLNASRMASSSRLNKRAAEESRKSDSALLDEPPRRGVSTDKQLERSSAASRPQRESQSERELSAQARQNFDDFYQRAVKDAEGRLANGGMGEELRSAFSKPRARSPVRIRNGNTTNDVPPGRPLPVFPNQSADASAVLDDHEYSDISLDRTRLEENQATKAIRDKVGELKLSNGVNNNTAAAAANNAANTVSNKSGHDSTAAQNGDNNSNVAEEKTAF